MKTAWHLSLLPYPVALALAVGLGVATYLRVPEPTVYRSSWCPRPEDRAAMSREVTPMSDGEVIDRLRLVRIRLNTLADHGRLGSGDEAEAVDAMLRELISDIQVAATPVEEPKP